jgi:hypothetical protein
LTSEPPKAGPMTRARVRHTPTYLTVQKGRLAGARTRVCKQVREGREGYRGGGVGGGGRGVLTTSTWA